MTTLSPSLIRCPFELRVTRGGAAEVGEGGEHPQRLLDRARDQRGVVEQEPALLGVLHQRPHAAAVGRLGAVVAGRDEEEEAHHDLVLLQLLAVDLGVDEDAGQVVGRVLAPGGDHLAAALEDLGHAFWIAASMCSSMPLGLKSGSPAPSVEFISSAQTASSSSGIPMKLPITRETTGWATSVTRSHVSRPVEPVEHADDDRADLVLVGGDPLRREARLEEGLDSIVLGRVHADEHRPRKLDREDLGDQGDAAEFRGVGLPVAADRVHVVRRGHRPVSGRLRGTR